VTLSAFGLEDLGAFLDVAGRDLGWGCNQVQIQACACEAQRSAAQRSAAKTYAKKVEKEYSRNKVG